MITRRQFLIGSLAFGGLATSAFGKKMNLASMPISEGYGALVADPQKLLDLPEGFSYKLFQVLAMRCLTVCMYLIEQMVWDVYP